MKTSPRLLVGLLFSAAIAQAQPTSPPPSAPPAGNVAPLTANVAPLQATPGDIVTPGTDASQRTPEQLNQLLGPIALYPDALIAIILPAATNASDIVLASRFLAAASDGAQIDAQPWDESVKSLSRYPEVVKWMDQNLEWTKQLGEAFAAQPADVMNAVQRLRTEARAAGTLVDTPQQQIVAQDDAISIVPAQPDVIYVPRYDPEIVFIERPRTYGYSYISFGPAYPVGAWLSYDCDWHQRRIWVDHRFADGRSPRDWRRPTTFPVGSNFAPNSNFRPWRPSPTYVQSRVPDPQWRSRQIVRPAPLNGAPIRADNARRDNQSHWWSSNSSTPRTAPADGRNHGSWRNRSDAPANAPVAPVAASESVGRSPSRPITSAMPAPGFANPSAPNPARTTDRRERGPGTESARGINPPNYRAGAIERPRSLSAPGIPADRSGPATRNATVRSAPPAARPAPAQAARAPAPVAAAPSHAGSANDGGGRNNAHDR